ncbi:MAG: archaellin/type IV pilin N-terminal domain-containing protein [Nitrososphaerales archaeon]
MYRAKMHRKAVTPVIATIILIAGTLVLALVVGAYTFGLFGSNVKTVTLSSATLYGGTEGTEPATVGVPAQGASYLVFALNNPGSTSSISGLTLTGSGITSVNTWGLINGTAATFTIATSANPQGVGTGLWANGLTGGTVTSYTFYPFGTAQSITTGQVYNYVVSFSNGQSVSGSLIAQ